MENKKLLTSLLIIVLLIVAMFVFGYLKNRPVDQAADQSSDTSLAGQQPQSPQDQSQKVATPSPVVGSQPQPSKDQPQGEKPAPQSSLTVDEKAALAASSNGSKVEADQQAVLAAKAAKETGLINVTGCQLDPVVLKVKHLSSFTLKNKGTDTVSVVFYADNVTHSVPAGGDAPVKADFGKQGSGLFGYYCRATSGVYPGLLLMYNP